MKLPRKLTMNAIIDYAAFAIFVFLTTTGVLMRYLLPPGSGHQSSIWGLDRHEWGSIHFWMSLALFGILSLHIVLHWNWIMSVLRGKPRQGSRSKFLLGAGSLIAVVALGISPVLSPVQVEEREQRDRAERSEASGFWDQRDDALDFEDVSIYGAMTLREIAETTGVPTAYIARQLGIDGIADDQRIGRLGRDNGFDVSDVRRIVAGYHTHQGNGDK